MNRVPTPPAADDCFATAVPLLKHDDAIAALSSRIVPVVGHEAVPLSEANGRVVAEPVLAPIPVPMHTNSAVDGYAVHHDLYASEPDRQWPVVGRAAAGRPFEGRVAAGATVQIFTGAVMPEGTDTVAMQEDVERLRPDGSLIRVPAGLKRGANVRRQGEDVTQGSLLFPAGHLLRPQDLAALASLGVAKVVCCSRLKVGVLSTGDEVREPGSGPLRHGDVYDANAPMLAAMASLSGALVTSYGILPDDPVRLEAALLRAAQECDLILTSGGASRGEEDHVADALERLGTRHFWQIAVKPGRPMMFGQIGRTIVVGLPGNPVAVFVCYLMYVAPLLARLGGQSWRRPRHYLLPAAFEVAKRKPGRREFWRGMIIETEAGPRVDKFARDGSGLISGLRAADGLIDVPEETPRVEKGDLVRFIPFSEFGIVGCGADR